MKYKVGDTVRIIDVPNSEAIITSADEGGYQLDYIDGVRGSLIWDAQNLELVTPSIPSPIVTETTTRIEPGVYGRLAISKQAGTDTRRILVNLADENGYCGTTSHGWSFDELCAAIETLTAVKTHLESQKP